MWILDFILYLEFIYVKNCQRQSIIVILFFSVVGITISGLSFGIAEKFDVKS